MTQTKNSEFDTDMERINHQIQMIGNSKNILNLGGSIFSDIFDEKKIKFSKIKTEINVELCEYLDKLSIENSWKEEVSKLNEKYDIIILDNLLDTTKHTGILLQNMNSILSEDGSIIASVRNNRYFLNTWETLGGIFSQIPNEHDYYEFNVDSLFTFLGNSHLTISKLIRIKIKNQTNLELNSQSSFSPVLFETLKKDPESDVFSYVVEIKKKSSDDEKTREWVTEFRKNYFLESLKSEIEKNENLVEYFKKRAIIIEKEIQKHIETALLEKASVEKGLEHSKEETQKYIEKIEGLSTDNTITAELESKDDRIKRLEKELVSVAGESAFELESKDERIKRLEKELVSVGEEKASELESQNERIKRLEKEVVDAKYVTQTILESKREIKNIFENSNDSNLISKLQSDNMDKTLLGLQALLAEYADLRNALKSSKAYNLMKKLDKIRGK